MRSGFAEGIPMAEVTYVLNALVCLACTWLLFAAWRRGRSRLLLLSASCFALLTMNNLLVLVDELVWTQVDLGVARVASALAGFTILLFGLIWESD